jgi:hypothetical protein
MNRDDILTILSEFKRDCAEKYGILVGQRHFAPC